MPLSDIPEHVLVKLLTNVDVFNTTDKEPLRVTALAAIKDILSEHFPHVSKDAVISFVMGMAKELPETPPVRPSLNPTDTTHPAIPPLNLPSHMLGSNPPMHCHSDVVNDRLRSRIMPTDARKLSPEEAGISKLRSMNESIRCRMDMERFPDHHTRHPQYYTSSRSLLNRAPPSYAVDHNNLTPRIASTHRTVTDHISQTPHHTDDDHAKRIEARCSHISQRLAELSMNNRYNTTPRCIRTDDTAQSYDLDNVVWMSTEEREYYHTADATEQTKIQQIYGNVQKARSNVPIRFKVLLSGIPEHTKAAILKKLECMSGPFESAKYMGWLETLLNVPFGNIKPLPISSSSGANEITDYIAKCKHTLDKSVLGHDALKDVLACVIASWIRTDGNATAVNALGIKGPIGVGKTTIIRSGLAAAVDRPFAFISCGGSSGASLLNGHSFTYEGSLPGAIVDSVISTGCVNPIILLDEVDKISTDARGDEVFNTLLHLLDPSQNTEFQDRFLNVPLDISKAFFVLTYNDASRIPPVLRDRLLEVQVHDFETEEKVKIASNYLLPDILTGLGLPLDWMVIEEEALKHIITSKACTGMRSTRHALINIVSTLNMLSLSGERAIELFSSKSHKGDDVTELFKHACKPPFSVTRAMVDSIMERTTEHSSNILPTSMAMYS